MSNVLFQSNNTVAVSLLLNRTLKHAVQSEVGYVFAQTLKNNNRTISVNETLYEVIMLSLVADAKLTPVPSKWCGDAR